MDILTDGRARRCRGGDRSFRGRRLEQASRRGEPLVIEAEKAVLGIQRPARRDRALHAAPDRPPELAEASACPGQSYPAVWLRPEVAVDEGQSRLAVEERAVVERQDPAIACGDRAESVDAGAAIRAHIVAAIGEAGIGAVHVGEARVGLQAEQPRSELPVVAELAAGQGAGGAHHVTEDGRAEGIGDVGETERAAGVIANIEAAPIERRRLLRRRRRNRQELHQRR